MILTAGPSVGCVSVRQPVSTILACLSFTSLIRERHVRRSKSMRFTALSRGNGFASVVRSSPATPRHREFHRQSPPEKFSPLKRGPLLKRGRFRVRTGKKHTDPSPCRRHWRKKWPFPLQATFLRPLSHPDCHHHPILPNSCEEPSNRRMPACV